MAPFVILFIVVFLVLTLVSLYSGFFQFRTAGGGSYGGREIQDVFVGLENHQYTVAFLEFWKGIGQVVFCIYFQVPVMILMVLVLALLLDPFLTRHITVYRLGYFLPFAIPGVMAIMVWLHPYNPEVSPLVQGLHVIDLPTNFFNKNVILASVTNVATWTHTGCNMLIPLATLQATPAELSEVVCAGGTSGLQIMTWIKVSMLRGATLLAVLPSIVGMVQPFNKSRVMSSVPPWMDKPYTPMTMVYNIIMGTLIPSRDGPDSIVATVMALIAGVLAVGYFLVDRKVGSND